MSAAKVTEEIAGRVSQGYEDAEVKFAALPPDVREVYDLPTSSETFWGYAPVNQGRSPK